MATKAFRALVFSFSLAIAPGAFGQFRIDGSVINAANTSKHHVFLTYDDGSGEPGPDGSIQMDEIGAYLSQQRIRATYALVACHFIGQDKAVIGSSMCYGYGDIPTSAADKLISWGHDIVNHSQNHLPLTGLTDPAQIIYEVGNAQIFIDANRDNSPRLFRGPGLAFNGSVGMILNGNASTATIQGPLDVDVGGDLYNPDTGNYMGGDWDCIAQGISVQVCGGLYIKAIKAATHGVVILLHVRTEGMTGADGNNFPLLMTKYLVEHLGPEYTYQVLDAIPGVHGDLTASFQNASSEFGTNDGVGGIVVGALDGPNKPSSVCKLRLSAMWCIGGDGNGGLLPTLATLRTTINASRFWLADINNDGYDDVVFQDSNNQVRVAFNDDQGGFHDPVLYSAGPLPPMSVVRFGTIWGGPLKDMAILAPGGNGVAAYHNIGVRFDATPIVYPPPALLPPIALATGTEHGLKQIPFAFDLFDMDGDGWADLVMRQSGEIVCALNNGSAGFGKPFECAAFNRSFADGFGTATATQADSFAITTINGAPALTGALSGTGLVFAAFVPGTSGGTAGTDAAAAFSIRYRYLCNGDCVGSAAQIAWGKFGPAKTISPIFISEKGLSVGVIAKSP